MSDSGKPLKPLLDRWSFYSIQDSYEKVQYQDRKKKIPATESLQLTQPGAILCQPYFLFWGGYEQLSHADDFQAEDFFH